MKKQFIQILAVILTAVVAAVNLSCNDEEETPFLRISPSTSIIELAASGKTLAGSSFTPMFTIETNQRGWTATSDKDWVHINESTNSFTVTADEVTGITSPAAAQITVKAGNAEMVVIEVRQSAQAPSLTVSPPDREIIFSSDGETATSGGKDFSPTFTVTQNVGEWKVASNQPWLTWEATDTEFTLIAAPNMNPEAPATATVTVTAGSAQAVTITVKQVSNQSKYKNIVNPYEEVNFSTTKYLRGQFHLHTRASDAPSMPVETYFTNYTQRGFDIIAVTDHDGEASNSGQGTTGNDYRNMSPNKDYWTYFTGLQEGYSRELLVIQGVEISNYPNWPVNNSTVSKLDDHFNNFFVTEDFWACPRRNGMKADIGAQIAGTDGIMVLNHPWRSKWTNPTPEAFYTDLLNTYPANRLIGIENGSIRDREIWDATLTTLAPGRNVFGFATDDAHSLTPTGTSFFGFRWTEILAPANTVADVKESMRKGRSFAVHNNVATPVTPAPASPAVSQYGVSPKVKNIVVNLDDMTIAVEAENYSKIEWFSCGKSVSVNKTTLKPDELDLDKYVRFVLTGANWTLYSQPFLLETN